MMETDNNEEGTVRAAVESSGVDGRLFAIITSIPDVVHKIKEMLTQSEKQYTENE